MAERAFVTSTEAIEAFRAALIVYMNKARLLLEEACDDVLRMRVWLQNDRRIYWENEVRRRGKKLEEAQQALFSASIASLREPGAAEQEAVHRARRHIAEAEAKLRIVKQWTRELDNRVEPQVRQLETLRTMLSNDMPKAAAHLSQVVRMLDEYAGVAPPAASAGPGGPAPTGEAGAEQPDAADAGADSNTAPPSPSP